MRRSPLSSVSPGATSCSSVAALREALGRLPETGHDELRFAATLRLGVSEFNRGNTEAAWACAEALPKLEVCLRTWYLEAQRRWLVGRLYHRALEEGEPQAGSEEASEEAMRKHLEKTAKLCELHGGRKGVDMALRELDVLARFYRERERADEYLEMLCRIGEYRNKRFYGSYYGPFCRYEVI